MDRGDRTISVAVVAEVAVTELGVTARLRHQPMEAMEEALIPDWAVESALQGRLEVIFLVAVVVVVMQGEVMVVSGEAVAVPALVRTVRQEMVVSAVAGVAAMGPVMMLVTAASVLVEAENRAMGV